MNKEIYLLTPEYKERIWGGTRLQEVFGFDTDIQPLGEAWTVTSLVGNADNRIEALDTTLNTLYQEHRELFGTSDDLLPVKVMIIASEQNLSVQVHPNDAYALEHDHSLGKPEAWYIIDAKEGAKIEFGHTAKNKEELKQMIQEGKWDELLQYVSPKKGDFLFVPDGVMHALGKDLLVFEISKNADLTYRVYDYDRVDAKTGKKRELHLEKSLDVLHAPFNEPGLIHPEAEMINGCEVTNYFDVPKQFTFKRILVEQEGDYLQEEFGFYFIADGQGMIDGHKVKKGETYFVPKGHGNLHLFGKLDILLATYREQ
ncbi:MAG: class I mannose-6-phosphate isomerase [Erysipelotrichaceae bacterium]|nr:class I mannose-6-phosphate isomerase [Erysipelotrichaceae bacterium]